MRRTHVPRCTLKDKPLDDEECLLRGLVQEVRGEAGVAASKAVQRVERGKAGPTWRWLEARLLSETMQEFAA